MAPISFDFAQHVLDRRASDLPGPIHEEMSALVLDYLGVALGGSRTDAAQIVARYQVAYGESGEKATVFGHEAKLSAAGAAFANAVAAHSLEMDDTDQRSMVHLSAPVASAALAMAEAVSASGPEFLRALAAGCEIMQAVSDAVNPGMRDRGLHSTAVCGVFGATAAAGCLLGLDRDELVSAFGAAGAHAAGLFEIYGPTMQKSLHPGPAAQNGIVAARLAKLGFEGADTIFDGRFGLFNAFTAEAMPEAALERLRSNRPLGIEYKPYACFRPIHAAIDAALAARAETGDDPSCIASLVLHRHPMWADYHFNPEPATEQAAKGSINHGVAVALVTGGAGLEQFAAKAIASPEVRRLSQLLSVEVDDTLPRGDSCRLTVMLSDGQNIETRADFPKGSAQNPFSVGDHEEKFRYLTAPLLSPEVASAVMACVGALHEADNLRALTDKLAIGQDAPSPAARSGQTR